MAPLEAFRGHDLHSEIIEYRLIYPDMTFRYESLHHGAINNSLNHIT